jgi:hypothetical protein
VEWLFKGPNLENFQQISFFEEINQAVQDSKQGQVFKPVLMMAG